jgi:hypothetical protein
MSRRDGRRVRSSLRAHGTVPRSRDRSVSDVFRCAAVTATGATAVTATVVSAVVSTTVVPTTATVTLATFAAVRLRSRRTWLVLTNGCLNGLLVIGSGRVATGWRWWWRRFGVRIRPRARISRFGVSKSLGLVCRPISSLPEIDWWGRLCHWVGLACRR